jgi:probable F420-dependent oxidoreductase
VRFSVQLPTDRVSRADEFVTGPAVMEMARAVEASGLDACFVTDHPFPGDRWLAGGGHHSLDPFVALSFAASATTKLRVQTHVLVLPYRNPFLVAKAAASLDVLSGGRLILGVSAGYLKSEFAALGAEFESRNDAADEGIRALKAAWTEEGVELSGRGFEARGNTMLPRPIQQPHPPLWVGGNSRRAIRRAVELGDGWVPFPTQPGGARFVRTAALESVDDLRERLAYLREVAQGSGRTRPLDIALVPFGLDMFARGPFDAGRFREGALELAELGVTWLTLSLPSRTRAEYQAEAERFGREVIAKL